MQCSLEKKKTFLRRLSWEFGGRKLLILQRNFIVWKHKLYFCLGKVIYTLMNINAPFTLNDSIKIVYLCISFFFPVKQTSMNVRLITTGVTQTRTASILLARTPVSVNQDLPEVVSVVNVSK